MLTRRAVTAPWPLETHQSAATPASVTANAPAIHRRFLRAVPPRTAARGGSTGRRRLDLLIDGISRPATARRGACGFRADPGSARASDPTLRLPARCVPA